MAVALMSGSTHDMRQVKPVKRGTLTSAAPRGGACAGHTRGQHLVCMEQPLAPFATATTGAASTGAAMQEQQPSHPLPAAAGTERSAAAMQGQSQASPALAAAGPATTGPSGQNQLLAFPAPDAAGAASTGPAMHEQLLMTAAPAIAGTASTGAVMQGQPLTPTAPASLGAAPPIPIMPMQPLAHPAPAAAAGAGTAGPRFSAAASFRCGMRSTPTASAALGGAMPAPVLHRSGAACQPPAHLGVQAAAGGRRAWRSACPGRNTAALCSAVAVYAAQDAGGASDSDKVAELERDIKKTREQISQAVKDGKSDVAIQALRDVLNSLISDLELLRPSQGRAPGAAEPTVSATHTAFLQALCAAKEELVVEGDVAGPAVLRLMADVIFPELRLPTKQGQGTFPVVLVRKCWRQFQDLILRHDRTLVIGTPGIGKSVFAWWFIGKLVELGFTVIHQKEKSARSYLCKDGRVLVGTRDAFDNLSEDPNTWRVYDGMEPDAALAVSTKNRILVVSSPNRDRYKLFLKTPGVVQMAMPRWDLQEIQLGWQHVYPPTSYPDMTAERVDNLFTYYNGVPRWVLGKPSEVPGPSADQLDLRDFTNSVKTCDAAKVLQCAAKGLYETVPEQYHRLLHIIPTSADFQQFRVEFSSRQAFLEVWQEAKDQGAAILQAFWNASAGDPKQAVLRGHVFEGATIQHLTSSSSTATKYDVRHLDKAFGPTTSRSARQRNVPAEYSTTIAPGRKLLFTFDNIRYAQQLQSSWQKPGAWSTRTLLTPDGTTFPEVDCIMLPAPPEAGGTVDEVELFQITIDKKKDIDRQALANVLCALPDAARYTLSFVVPKDHYKAFRIESISRRPVTQGQDKLDRVVARVIANADGVNMLCNYSSFSFSEDSSSQGTEEADGVMSGDDENQDVSGDDA